MIWYRNLVLKGYQFKRQNLEMKLFWQLLQYNIKKFMLFKVHIIMFWFFFFGRFKIFFDNLEIKGPKKRLHHTFSFEQGFLSFFLIIIIIAKKTNHKCPLLHLKKTDHKCPLLHIIPNIDNAIHNITQIY